MIPFICGFTLHAQDIARRAGLKPCDWRILNHPHQLMGHYKPNVVMLDTANHFKPAVVSHMHDMLLDRSAIIWTELDLIEGRVPLS